MGGENNRRAQYNVRAKNILTFDLMLDEFYRAFQCEDAKEIWEILEVTREGPQKSRRQERILSFKKTKCLECCR